MKLQSTDVHDTDASRPWSLNVQVVLRLGSSLPVILVPGSPSALVLSRSAPLTPPPKKGGLGFKSCARFSALHRTLGICYD